MPVSCLKSNHAAYDGKTATEKKYTSPATLSCRGLENPISKLMPQHPSKACMGRALTGYWYFPISTKTQNKRVKEKETRSQWVEKHSFSYSIKPFFKNTDSFQVKHAIRAAKITP